MKQTTAFHIIRMQLRDALPHIFSKSLVFVSPSTSMWEAALLLVPLRKMYTSGIVIVKDNQPIGLIGPHHILQELSEKNSKKLKTETVEQIMQTNVPEITDLSLVEDILRNFRNTGFGFLPIIRNNHIQATVSTRDFLPLIGKFDINIPASTIASKLVFVSEGITLKSILAIMLQKKIRKVGIRENDTMKIIDDRAIFEFLCMTNMGKPNPLETDIEYLPKSNTAKCSVNDNVSHIAKKLVKDDLPCAILEDSKIITPWDLTMKVLGPYLAKYDLA